MSKWKPKGVKDLPKVTWPRSESRVMEHGAVFKCLEGEITFSQFGRTPQMPLKCLVLSILVTKKYRLSLRYRDSVHREILSTLKEYKRGKRLIFV